MKVVKELGYGYSVVTEDNRFYVKYRGVVDYNCPFLTIDEVITYIAPMVDDDNWV